MIKLNLGCGIVRLPGYISIDKNVECDLKYDILQPLPYEKGSVDEILASHLLEHFTFMEMGTLLQDWKRILKVGGIVHVRVPDLIACMKKFIDNDDGRRWEWWIKTIYGGQWNAGEYHKTGFTKERLILIMGKYGFTVKEDLGGRPKADPEFDIIFIKNA